MLHSRPLVEALLRLLVCVTWSFVLADTVDIDLSQLAYFKPSNTGTDYLFGRAISVSGNIVVIGAPREDSCSTGVNGDQQSTACRDSGAGYIFVRNESTGQWSQEAYLKSSYTRSKQWFGEGVSVWGNIVVVGAEGETSCRSGVNEDQTRFNCTNSGGAYIFSKSESTGQWFQEAHLKPSNADSESRFGHGLSVWGSVVAVGAWREASCSTGVNGNQQDKNCNAAGAVYVFSKDQLSGLWAQEVYIKSSNTASQDLFGYSVSLWKKTMVVSAPWEDSCSTGVNGNQNDNACAQAGSAYIFSQDQVTGQWFQEAYLKASNSGSGDVFGYAVGIWGSTVVVGAYGDGSCSTEVNGNQQDNSCQYAGGAYVFSKNEETGQWQQQAYLKPNNMANFLLFGASVAIWERTVVVGAAWEFSCATGVNGVQLSGCYNAGAAYVFLRNELDGKWSQQAYLKSSNTGANHKFSYSVSIYEDIVVVGAPYESSCSTGVNGNQKDTNCSDSGSAYLFGPTGLPLVSVSPTFNALLPVSPSSLEVSASASVSSSPSSTAVMPGGVSDGSHIKTKAIVGGIVTGIVVGAILLCLLRYLIAKSRSKMEIMARPCTADNDRTTVVASEFATIPGSEEIRSPSLWEHKLVKGGSRPSLREENLVNEGSGHRNGGSGAASLPGLTSQQPPPPERSHLSEPQQPPSHFTSFAAPVPLVAQPVPSSERSLHPAPVEQPLEASDSLHSFSGQTSTSNSGSQSPHMLENGFSSNSSDVGAPTKDEKTPNWLVLSAGSPMPSDIGCGQRLITLDDDGNVIFWKPEAQRRTGAESGQTAALSADPSGTHTPAPAESTNTTFPPTPADPHAEFYPRRTITLKYKNKRVAFALPYQARNVGHLKKMVATRLGKDINSFTLWIGDRELLDMLEDLSRFNLESPDQALNFLVEARNISLPGQSGSMTHDISSDPTSIASQAWTSTSSVSTSIETQFLPDGDRSFLLNGGQYETLAGIRQEEEGKSSTVR
eukprot:gb/GEZN01001332.1/.p1 GENE.gb/GEZN01001332.1/~~gb/GEZN01001332.1/.p1  ORF type:complete len:1002 (+),score=106.74 gb/GEZN01001332.1/:97-3102(+)